MSGGPEPGEGEGGPLPGLEERLALLLRIGVIASAAVLLVGGWLFLVRHGQEPVRDRAKFSPEPPQFSRPVQIARAARAGSGRAIIQLGIVLLIATPIARVAYSVQAFARRRDLAYTAITLVVLGVLLYGLLSGQVHG